MKKGDLVRFVRSKVDVDEQGGMFLREDVVGIVIKKVRHLEDMWIVHFPRIGGADGYLESWLEVINENKTQKR